jgi:hypothetical protein
VLFEQLAEARAARCSIVTLSGAPGVGKSRLLDEFPPDALDVLRAQVGPECEEPRSSASERTGARGAQCEVVPMLVRWSSIVSWMRRGT